MLEALIHSFFFFIIFFLMLYIYFAIPLVLYSLWKKLRYTIPFLTSFLEPLPHLKALTLTYAIAFLPLVFSRAFIYMNLYLLALLMLVIGFIAAYLAIPKIYKKFIKDS